jgi:hypothetical protein
MTRGFIQYAGFTFGKATSFFDFVPTAAFSYNSGMLYSPDTGDIGQMVATYTAQFGSGVSASIGVEQSRRSGTVNLSTATGLYDLPPLTNPAGSNYGGMFLPNVGLQDVVGNARVDQAWGAAQISAALHDTRASYYSNGAATSEDAGHPGSKWGWAVSGGVRLNAPAIGAGDYFVGQAVYSQGAIRYVSMRDPGSAALNRWSGNTVGYGFWEDAVFSNGNGIELTTAWGVTGAYEHFWTPSLRTSIYGSYMSVSHSGPATSWICHTQTGANSAFQSPTTCNPDWSSGVVGSRTQWNISRDLYIGADVSYLKLYTASPNAGNTITTTVNSGGKPAGTYTVADQDVWAATWRIHRDIVP